MSSQSSLPVADLDSAAAVVERGGAIVGELTSSVSRNGGPDAAQQLAYDLAHCASAVATAKAMLAYGAKGPIEAALTCAFVADVGRDLAARAFGREAVWGDGIAAALDEIRPFVATFADPTFVASLASQPGPRHLDEEFEMVADTFHRLAANKVRPVAEHVHRTNSDIPESVIEQLAEIGGFGLSVPEEYGGFAAGGDNDYLAMMVATEELSWGSLGVGGSLITRPEILTRALVMGGTEEQKQYWLPKLATAEVLAAIAVTEPDYGSDVAGLKVTARPAEHHESGEAGWVINGVKTWCTFAARANVFLLLARTNPEPAAGHKGLSLFIVPKPQGDGHGFQFAQEGGGRIEGRAIDTIGYRGMHSYEVAFEDWWVPADHQIGGDAGLGRGFYLQMQGFENGRVQTAARAVGLMQAAYEAAVEYANARVVFGAPIMDYQLTQVKLGRMAAIIQASRQFMYEVARMMARGEGALEASMVKAYVCRAAEWVTREAMQIHGGMGYAEEFPVSRYFVDARVLSIFEGADETLCLKVIARRLSA